MIENLTERLEAAAKELVKFSEGAPADQVYEAVRAIENDADKLVYESEEHFAKVFVTPIDREDLQALIVAIDDIIDLIYLVSRTFVLYGVPKPTTAMAEQMRLLVVLAEVLRTEIGALARHEYERLIAAGRVIRGHEKTGDKIFREAVAGLFHDPDIDAKVLVRDKEILEDLENAIDKFEIVAERLKNLAVKHG
ncbi:MAG: DUF47 family protein [Deltaproteobacteria bacterium]|nr:DUF47 family protein [Deltaproteobacteria bacterium]